MRVLARTLIVVVILTGCASLAVTPCDTVADRDGKYFGRFFLGVATIGLSEVTIQHEEIRQAYQGSPGCPPPAGVRVVSASAPSSTGGDSVALGTLVNVAPWAIAVYLNQDPDAPGAPPLTILFPRGDLRLAFRPGQHRLVARPTGAAPGDLPRVTGFVAESQRRRIFVNANRLADVQGDGLRLRSWDVDLNPFKSRPGEVLVGRDVIDQRVGEETVSDVALR